MNEFKKIELRLSELRTALNKSYAIAEPTAEEMEARQKLLTEYEETEKRYQQYLQGQISKEEQRAVNDNPEAREYSRLESEMRLWRFVEATVEQRGYMDGVEREFQQILGMSGLQVPMEAIAPRQEQRDDAVTNLAANPAGFPITGHPILSRVFAESDVDVLGITMVMAGVGEQTFPLLTGGVAPGYVAKAAQNDAVAATYAFHQLGPLAYSGRYVFNREDIARLQGYEESLRRDLSMAMGDYYADHIINGAANPTGLIPSLVASAMGVAANWAGADVNNDANTKARIVAFLKAVNVWPDGKWAGSVGEVSILLSQLINQLVMASVDNSGRPYRMNEILEGFRGYGVSGHLRTKANKSPMFVIAHGKWTPGSAVLVTWPSVDLIYDPYTLAGQREIVLTASNLWNFEVLRTDPWKLYEAPLA